MSAFEFVIWSYRSILKTFKLIRTIETTNAYNCIIIIIIIIITAIELSLGGSSPYTSTDKTNKNKYT
jgi:hypothetical protein